MVTEAPCWIVTLTPGTTETTAVPRIVETTLTKTC
jgi:hypothetical protein